MNKIGKETFLRDLGALQLFEDEDRMERTHSLIQPVNKFKLGLRKLMESWVLLVFVSFSLLTLKILVESIGSLRWMH